VRRVYEGAVGVGVRCAVCSVHSVRACVRACVRARTRAACLRGNVVEQIRDGLAVVRATDGLGEDGRDVNRDNLGAVLNASCVKANAQ
jgi:hypothetical protein